MRWFFLFFLKKMFTIVDAHMCIMYLFALIA